MRNKALMLMAVSAAMVMALGLAACGGSSSSSAAASSSGASASSEAVSSEASSSEAASSEAASDASAEGALTEADLAAIDVEIALDDYDAMSTLATDIQNGRATGQVVKIDGYVTNFAKGMSYSISENNADNSGNVGTVFVIEGVDEEAYPSDGTHIVIVGKVVADGYAFNIHTLPDFVQVVE